MSDGPDDDGLDDGSSDAPVAAADTGAPEGRRLAWTVAVASTAMIGAGLVAYAVFVAGQWVRQDASEPVNAGLLVAFSALWGIGLLACARGLARRRRWARAPVVTSALLLITVGWLLATGTGSEVGFGWLVLVISVACLVTVLTSAARRELE